MAREPHKAESARLLFDTVQSYDDLFYSATGSKMLKDLLLCYIEAEVADVESRGLCQLLEPLPGRFDCRTIGMCLRELKD